MVASEEFIKFLWKHRLGKGMRLHSTCGRELIVLCPGEPNPHSGPDYVNARVRMDALLWAGNVEIHLRTSDWYRHGHHIDPAYNNVILHVAGVHDSDTVNSLGRNIPTLVPAYPYSLLHRFQCLEKNAEWLPCSAYIHEVPENTLAAWLRKLQTQRLLAKSRHISEVLPEIRKHREKAFYLALASGYGLPLNSLPFELLAKGVPYQRMLHFRASLWDLEALYFGQSGLLYPARRLGPYPAALWDRYRELCAGRKEKTIPRHLWKFLRLRPASFPTLRISQFATTYHKHYPLFDTLIGTDTLAEMELMLRTTASEYWNSHYLFGKCSPSCPKFLGQQSVSMLMINVLAPFLHALGKQVPKSPAASRSREILAEMGSESNRIIRSWREYGICAQNAGESQALLQLFHVYCKQKRCLCCQIGIAILEAAFDEKK